MKKELILTAILAAVAATGCSSQAPVQTKTQAETTEKAQEAVPEMPPEGQKGDKGNKPFYEGKINGFTMRTMTVTVWNTWSTAKIPLTR